MIKIPIHVVDEDEAEQADFCVCASASTKTPWSNNLTGACADCGEEVIYRPSAPKLPPKLCLDCALLRMEATSGTH